ncbi:amidohydrolase [Aquabacterium lacunae]|uniref:Amidohydrolase n=1 Tax=Aquabacterium lacunae TaxID=2528630 RepID=A0A4Q9H3Z1_9BURK|nr:amidohydrolase family protein [Aquabacterium lacunae]TBO31206.1 amidohydrolase [Aquabacterium lacunae]
MGMPSSASRRHCLQSALGLAAGAATQFAALPTRAAAAPTRIDVHAHLIPDFYRSALKTHEVEGDGGLPTPAWSPDAAVDFMNKFGIQAQVVSLSEPGFGFLPDPSLRRQMARQINDYIRDALVGAPAWSRSHRRFGGFASLPLGNARDSNEVLAAIDEANRAMNLLKLDGIGLYTHYQGVYLGDPLLNPLMRALNDLEAMVFIHPVAPPVQPELKMPTFVLEFPFETTRAVTNMLYKGIFWRYPKIRWLLPHAGGTIPFLSHRAGLLALQLNPRNSAFSQLYFDTALSAAPASMAATREITPTSHILFGSDFPYAQLVYGLKFPGDPNPELNDSFSAAERQMVDRSNALTQLPRLAQRLG